MERLTDEQRDRINLPGVSARRKRVIAKTDEEIQAAIAADSESHGHRITRRHPLESDVQHGIVAGLKAYGLLVQVTSRQRKGVFCSRCQTWLCRTDGDGATPGLLDLNIRRDWDSRFGKAWPPLIWTVQEVKPYKGAKISLEQQALVNSGAGIVVYCLDDALAGVARVDAMFAEGAA